MTAVEKRLADMAAQGLSDDDIAQRFFVMRKTVESIVGGACAKVAAGSRAELRGALAGAH